MNAEREELATDEVRTIVNQALEIFDQLAEIARRRDVMINFSVTPFDQRVSADDVEEDGGD